MKKELNIKELIQKEEQLDKKIKHLEEDFHVKKYLNLLENNSVKSYIEFKNQKKEVKENILKYQFNQGFQNSNNCKHSAYLYLKDVSYNYPESDVSVKRCVCLNCGKVVETNLNDEVYQYQDDNTSLLYLGENINNDIIQYAIYSYRNLKDEEMNKEKIDKVFNIIKNDYQRQEKKLSKHKK